ncbi:hypothetical protein MTO96_010403 [Rhipicephalus appendiculatus]
MRDTWSRASVSIAHRRFFCAKSRPAPLRALRPGLAVGGRDPPPGATAPSGVARPFVKCLRQTRTLSSRPTHGVYELRRPIH